jgi:hypothetical protein
VGGGFTQKKRIQNLFASILLRFYESNKHFGARGAQNPLTLPRPLGTALSAPGALSKVSHGFFN